MQTLARHLDLASKSKEEERGRSESLCLLVPYVLVRVAAFAVALTLVLAELKLDKYEWLAWSWVLMPIIVTLIGVLVASIVAVGFWVRTTVLLYSGQVEIGDGEEPRLDIILRTAKICFLGHSYAALLTIGLGLLLAKLQFWPTLPVVYPILPVIMLGMVYIVLGIMLKQPEVDSPWYVLIGSTILTQSIMVAIKVDIATESEFLPWGAAFIPSWITYVILFAYVLFCYVDWSPLSSAQARKAMGIACWTSGWGLSQLLLTLRLDVEYKVSWLALLLPAFLGWVLTALFVTSLVSEYFENLAKLLFDTFNLSVRQDDIEEERPLLKSPRNRSPRPVD